MPKSLTIKDPAKELKFFRRRLLVLAIGIAILMMCLFARLTYLQVQQRVVYTTLSKANQLNLIPIPPTRGLIYDRHGVLLAENIPVFNLEIIPNKIQNLRQTIKKLQTIITINQEDIDAFYRQLRQKRRFEPVPLKIKLSPVEVAKFSVNRWKFPGVMVNTRMMRYYPLGATLSHVIGFVGRINTKELTQLDPANYSATNYIGKEGVEKYFEDQLHGTVGYQQVENDASGRVVRVLKRTPPIAGNTIYLTIDSELEKVAIAALGDENGAVVAIQPSTGQILALVSQPNYDPNLFVQGISTKAFHQLRASTDLPLINRAIRGLYAPGSTIKPYYGLEGLVSDAVSPQFSVFDPGFFKFSNHYYFNDLHRGMGWTNLQKAIMVSDDVYFYNLALKLGVKRLSDVLSLFGFGKSTDIEMGEELPGTVPTPLWKKKYFGKTWYPGDTINMGIGQGFLLATPLQIAQGVATLAERGEHYQPHLLLTMVGANALSITPQPIILNDVKIPARDWNLVIEGMHEVITNHQGTGFRFGRDAPYPVAAKTGTAQVLTIHHGRRYIANEYNLPKLRRDNSLFIAFAPVDDPKIAIAVVVEHSDIASAVARKVLDYYLLTEKNYQLGPSSIR